MHISFNFTPFSKLTRLLLIAGLILQVGCSPETSDEFNSGVEDSHAIGNRYLYVVSGSCYGGGVTVSAGSATVARYDQKTGQFDKLLIDYNSTSAGDMPISIVDKNQNNLMIAVENTGGRRVDILNKDTDTITTYLANTTALSGVIRSFRLLSDGSLLISKSTAIEKFNAAKARILIGVNPYINAPGSTCGTTATLIPAMTTLSNGKIVYVHAAATPNNKLAVISAAGYSTTADCLAAQAAPTTMALPTAILVHSSGKVLVAYGSTTASSNFIYSYDINATTNVISNVTLAYSDITNVNGPSAMTEDPETGDVFIANAISTYNSIERFSFNPTTRTLTKLGSSPFVPAQIYTRCVSSMMVGD